MTTDIRRSKVTAITICFFSIITLYRVKVIHELATNKFLPTTNQWSRSLPPKEVVFMIAGAVRTLNQTHPSLLNKWILPLCSPPSCIAHVVTHLSLSDNRPDIHSDDPKGQELTIDYWIDNINALFQGAVADWPDPDFLHFHHVPKYDIASDEESKAMDLIETETHNDAIRSKIRVLRYGDSRRYSMWFSRQWLWRFVKTLEQSRGRPFDFYAFTRPDMLWFIPAPPLSFFHDVPNRTEEDVWFHDSYYSFLPDTFAFLPTYTVADVYFSLERLVDVACLGGPNFNSSVVSDRLQKRNIEVKPSQWCQKEFWGWSEQILFRKMLGITKPRYLPAGTAILRPPNTLDCQTLDTRRFLFPFVKYRPSHLPFLSCNLVNYKIKNTFVDPLTVESLFSLHDKDNDGQCLSFNSNGTIELASCENSSTVSPRQVFSELKILKQNTNENILVGFGIETGIPVEIVDRISMEDWRIELLPSLYSVEKFEEQSPSTRNIALESYDDERKKI